MQLDESYKNKIGDQLIRKLAQSLKDAELPEEEVSQAASFVIDTLPNLQTDDELIDFLTQLAKKWPVFSDYLIIERGRLNEKNKDGNLDEVADLIKANKIDEAVVAAKNATDVKETN